MTDPDRRWVRRARRGDRQALVTLYERHKEALFGFLVRRVGERAGAEEVFQEVWVKVLRGIGGYREAGGSFRSWLFRVANNAAVDRGRREALRAGPSLDAPPGNGGLAMIDVIPTDEPGPERTGGGRLAAERLRQALLMLNAGQRAAVLLRHQQGLTYAEVARTLGVAEGTAKTMVHRGVRKLRESMTEWLDD